MPDKLLLVEGTFDKYFIEELLRQTPNKVGKLTIEPFKKKDEAGLKPDEKGIYALLRSLPVTIRATSPDNILGLIVDADISAVGRWQRIRQILTDAGYENLPDLFPNGLILSGNDILPRFGLWMMPDNQEQGIIENFIRQLIYEEDKLQPEVDFALDSLQRKNLQLFTDVHRPKAFIRTWLAWQEKPEMSFGVAVSKRVLTTDADLCLRFVSWLTLLFNAQ
ncbi:DUF3226 domain-containing protein [Spirosoma fluviale]|uniref:DUF4435 domain-containing protein n=1 Tax=Spirosoma fluviale TaxID=1597977 RepID=A0A286GHG5_9BACT|nr:DUF3226 domain-containing protein [Spirosoma fluviale]SOD94922.1 hypothetical protein SAMN06269250_4684 [Spirosoma fluviale]